MQQGRQNREDQLTENFLQVLGGISKFLIAVGGLASLACAGLLFYFIFAYSGTIEANKLKQAAELIPTIKTILTVSLLAFGAGSGFLWWQEPQLSISHILTSVALAGAPFYIPALQPDLKNAVQAQSLGAVQNAGTLFLVLATLVIVGQIVVSLRERMAHGMKADQLKHGKNIKLEKDAKNVLMGSCWQLPYCRKFVREKCPIFHSKRTCWREKVGCMCEEEVIRGAMENRLIPKDALAASKMIPYNNRITMQQKQERCKQCVIYNEHQKHKYKVSVPVIVVGTILVYIGLHGALIATLKGVFSRVDTILSSISVSGQTNISQQISGAAIPFHEVFLAAIMLSAMAYLLKTAEYIFFKIKL